MSAPTRHLAARLALFAVLANALAPAVTQLRTASLGESRLPEVLRLAYGLEQTSRLSAHVESDGTHAHGHGIHGENLGPGDPCTADLPCHEGPQCAYCATHAGSHGLAAGIPVQASPLQPTGPPAGPESLVLALPGDWNPELPRAPPARS